MERDQLFINVAGPVPATPAEVRPGFEQAASPLEDYVLGEMPTDLRRVSRGEMAYEELAAKQGDLLTESARQIAVNNDPHAAQITQLDLLFMLGGYIPSGKDMYRNAPPALGSLIQQQSARFEGLEPFMTYEMIIDVNAAEYERTGNIRVYADGEDGVQERDFYLGHHLAEPFVRDAAYQLHALVERPELHDVSAVLSSVTNNIDELGRYMGRFSKLSKGAFGYFRQYLGSYADGTRNASGAFMPSVQLLELATMAPTDTYDVFLDESMQYFPQWSRPVMQEWRESSRRGFNFEDRLNSGAIALNGDTHVALKAALKEFIDFRMAHLGITKAHIPDAFSSLDQLSRSAIAAQQGEQQILDPQYKGTAGFDVRNVLKNSVYRLLQLQERIEAFSVPQEA